MLCPSVAEVGVEDPSSPLSSRRAEEEPPAVCMLNTKTYYPQMFTFEAPSQVSAPCVAWATTCNACQRRFVALPCDGCDHGSVLCTNCSTVASNSDDTVESRLRCLQKEMGDTVSAYSAAYLPQCQSCAPYCTVVIHEGRQTKGTTHYQVDALAMSSALQKLTEEGEVEGTWAVIHHFDVNENDALGTLQFTHSSQVQCAHAMAQGHNALDRCRVWVHFANEAPSAGTCNHQPGKEVRRARNPAWWCHEARGRRHFVWTDQHCRSKVQHARPPTLELGRRNPRGFCCAISEQYAFLSRRAGCPRRQTKCKAWR